MAHSGGKILEGLLRAVAAAGVEGISIANLFSLLDRDFSSESYDKSLLWQNVLDSNKVAFVDEDGSKASTELHDILDVGLGGNKIKAFISHVARSAQATLLLPVGPVGGEESAKPDPTLYHGSCATNVDLLPSTSVSDTQSQHGDKYVEPLTSLKDPPSMPRKKRGRPPKKRAAEFVSSSSVAFPETRKPTAHGPGNERADQTTAISIDGAYLVSASHGDDKRQESDCHPQRSKASRTGVIADQTPWISEEAHQPHPLPSVSLLGGMQSKDGGSESETLIVRFRSSKFQNPLWLEENVGSWHAAYADILTAAVIKKQDQSIARRARGISKSGQIHSRVLPLAQDVAELPPGLCSRSRSFPLAVEMGASQDIVAFATDHFTSAPNTRHVNANLVSLEPATALGTEQGQADGFTKHGAHLTAVTLLEGRRDLKSGIQYDALTTNLLNGNQDLPPTKSSLISASRIPEYSSQQASPYTVVASSSEHKNPHDMVARPATGYIIQPSTTMKSAVLQGNFYKSTSQSPKPQRNSPCGPLSSISNSLSQGVTSPSHYKSPYTSVGLSHQVKPPFEEVTGASHDMIQKHKARNFILPPNGRPNVTGKVVSSTEQQNLLTGVTGEQSYDGSSVSYQTLGLETMQNAKQQSNADLPNLCDLDVISNDSTRNPESAYVAPSANVGYFVRGIRDATGLLKANSQSPAQHDSDTPISKEQREVSRSAAVSQVYEQSEAANRDAAIAHAQSHSLLPSHLQRLTSYYESSVGNLVLSLDNTIVEFFGLTQRPPELPLFESHVSEIADYPTISARNSYPLHLFIKKKQDFKICTHHFQYASTAEGSETAAVMRQKLITAMIVQNLRDTTAASELEDVDQRISKPWPCKKCGRRFKNDIGLKYHLTVAKGACNPNWSPPLGDVRKTPRPRKVSTRPKEGAPKRNSPKDSPRLSRAARTLRKPSRIEPSENECLSSEDSVFEWAERTAAQTAVPSNTYRWYKNLPKEVLLLEELAVDIKSAASILGVRVEDRPVLNLSTLLEIQERILELVRGNGGLFPGEKGLWIAMVSLWLKSRGPLTEPLENLPESKFCKQALDQLVDCGRLLRSTFEFKDNGKSKRTVSRSFVHEPGFDLTSPLVGSFKTYTVEALPDLYVPSQFTLPPDVMNKLQTNARGISVVDKDTDVSVSESASEYDSSGGPRSTIGDQYVTSKRRSTAQKTPRVSAVGDLQTIPNRVPYNRRPRSASFKAAAAAILKARWDSARAQGLNSLHPDRGPDFKPKRIRNAPTRKIGFENGYRPRKPTQLPASREAPDLSIMNALDPVKTVWPWATQIESSDRPPMLASNLKDTGIIRLPEPLTILQAIDGTWSAKPPGHGAGFVPSSLEIDSHIGGRRLRPATSTNQTGGNHLPFGSSNKQQENDPAYPKRILRPQSSAISSPLNPMINSSNISYHPEASEQLAWTHKRKKIRSEPEEPASIKTDVNFLGNPLLGTKSLQPNTFPARKLQATGSVKERADLKAENPGLRSLPPWFGLGFSVPLNDTVISDCPSRYDSVQFSASRKTTGSSHLDECSWEFDGWSIPCGRNFNVKWSKKHNWTMETIPYEELIDCDEIIEDSLSPRHKGGSQNENPLRSKTHACSTEMKFSMKRVQTAAPEDFDGILDRSGEASSRFVVEVTRNRLGPAGSNTAHVLARMNHDFERRFSATCIAVLVLAGGLESEIDFLLVNRIFPEFDVAFLRKRWENLQATNSAAISSMIQEFQCLFSAAYEAGEIPIINYNCLLDYDWDALVMWMMEKLNLNLTKKLVDFPSKRALIHDNFQLTEGYPDKTEKQKDMLFDRRLTDSHRWACLATGAKSLTVPQIGVGTTFDINELSIARTWVRATALTPHADWDQSFAAAKLGTLSLELVEQACESLVEERILVHRAKGRSIPGRAYACTDFFKSKFDRPIPLKRFVDAWNYKQQLDLMLSQNSKPIQVPKNASDGMMMCITSLQASSQLRTLPLDQTVDETFGADSGNDVVKSSRSAHFDVDLYPTPFYSFNTADPLLTKLKLSSPPLTYKGSALPAWTSITGSLNPEIWRMAVNVVSQTVAQRAGITTECITAALNPVLERWEIVLLMDWGEKVGLFARLDPDVEGWNVGRSWWLLLGYLQDSLL
ncbi:hypothetical protein GLAREA_03800 [Glarea lozoyensis ATCC 20868]|uniref:Transcription factor tau subunit sfc3/Tfc3 C-terminal domain-containing protein n=1 Tax=Glarea lozoyensis (strain ATCC 20868 / MF5171) TaxID=1116229 RepID=S3DWU2_GLAL2|nr:uncharacterized protein GLAREA_03800 [Glarea lozoyensis ATCC 20868]EPE30833.1 hypothetical protein GLAREA_03800 [Glarea lozoyensis ATCC 20868]